MPAIQTLRLDTADFENVLFAHESAQVIRQEGFGKSSGVSNWYELSQLSVSLNIEHPSAVLQYACLDIQTDAYCIARKNGVSLRLKRETEVSSVFKTIPITNLVTNVLLFNTWHNVGPGNHKFSIEAIFEDWTAFFNSKHIVLVLKN